MNEGGILLFLHSDRPWPRISVRVVGTCSNMLSSDAANCFLEAQHTDIGYDTTVHLAKRLVKVENFVSPRL